jgi:hypothetical protein
MDFNLRIDWELLRQQKEWLMRRENDDSIEAEGLLALIDDIQDQAVATSPELEEEVFGGDNV